MGESAANPYLYIAAQAAAGLDGIENKTDPGPISDDPYAPTWPSCRRRSPRLSTRSRPTTSSARRSVTFVDYS